MGLEILALTLWVVLPVAVVLPVLCFRGKGRFRILLPPENQACSPVISSEDGPQMETENPAARITAG